MILKQAYENQTSSDLLIDLGLDEANVQHLLAHGYSLTKFLTAPFSVSSASSFAIARAGATLSLLITLYDHLLDDRRMDPIGGGAAIAYATGNTMPASALSSIFYIYWDQVRQLRAEASPLWDRFLKYFALMFQEENLTLSNSTVNTVATIRKAAMPGVIMSYPAFLVAPAPTPWVYWSQFRWAYRVGDLLGMVDDAVDLEEDLASGSANRYLRGSERVGPSLIVDEIVKAADGVRNYWIQRCTEPQPLCASGALSVSLASWLQLI